ncbi:hypothetical protein BH11PSE2_BH11PSE2_08740 [soil metagenome]
MTHILLKVGVVVALAGGLAACSSGGGGFGGGGVVNPPSPPVPLSLAATIGGTTFGAIFAGGLNADPVDYAADALAPPTLTADPVIF